MYVKKISLKNFQTIESFEGEFRFRILRYGGKRIR